MLRTPSWSSVRPIPTVPETWKSAYAGSSPWASNGVYGPTMLDPIRTRHVAEGGPSSTAAEPKYLAVLNTLAPVRVSPSSVISARYLASFRVRSPSSVTAGVIPALAPSSTPCRRLRPPLVVVSVIGLKVCSLLTSMWKRVRLACTRDHPSLTPLSYDQAAIIGKEGSFTTPSVWRNPRETFAYTWSSGRNW